MKNYIKKNVKNKNDDNNTKKKIMLVILLVILLLSLITSCSCTSNFFGKIGNIFRNQGDIDITDKAPKPETIRNQNLKFNQSEIEIALTDTKAKLGFTVTGINPKEYTCNTSDANIATCHVIDDYVVINPKSIGEVTIYLQTKTNGKVYEATAKVTIGATNKYIELSSTSGTINLAFTNKKNISFKLVGLTGEVTATSSDESIAKATIKDGILSIEAFKVGNTKITLTLNYNGTSYTSVYTLSVVNNKNIGVVDNKNSDSKLSNLTTNKGKLSPEFDKNILEYDIGVSWLTGSIKLKATASNDKVQKNITYSYKRADKDNFETVKSLDKLTLKPGDNIVLITVTAENGNKTVYKVVINKADGTYLKSVSSSGEMDKKFDKNILNYNITTSSNKLDFSAIPENGDAKVTYKYRGEEISKDKLNGLQLVSNPNVLEVIVEYDGVTRNYTFNINKKGEEDTSSALLNLTDSLNKIAFNPNKNTYNIGVSHNTNEIVLSATANSNATITFQYQGKVTTATLINSITADNLEYGDNIVTITVTNGNNVSRYTVNINKSTNPDETGGVENKLINLFTVGTSHKLNPTFNEEILEYVIDIGTDNIISITAIADKALVEYKKDTDQNWTTGSSISLNNLPVGETLLLIRVSNSSGLSRAITVSRTYYITIIRHGINEDSIAELSEMIINGSKIDLDAAKNGTASIEVTGDVSLKAATKYNGTIESYTVNGNNITNIDEYLSNLAPGSSAKVVVNVLSKDGKNRTSYTVEVKKKKEDTPVDPDIKHTITFTNPNVTCTIGKECKIDYVITEIGPDGSGDVTGSYPNSSITATSTTLKVDKKTNGVLVIDYDANAIYPGKHQVKVSIPGATNIANITFIRESYKVSIDATSKEVKVIDGKVTDGNNVIVKTDMFDTNKINTKPTYSNGVLKICAKEYSNVCLTVTVPDAYKDKVTLEYNSKLLEENPNSLPIEIIPTGVVDATFDLTVSGYVFDKNDTIEEKKVSIEIAEYYTVILNAVNGSDKGIFSKLLVDGKPDSTREKVYKRDSTVIIADITSDAPKVYEGECLKKVLDYYQDKDGNKVETITTINSKVELTAVYRDKSDDDTELPYTFWLDLIENRDDLDKYFYDADTDKNEGHSLFYNKEAKDLYGDEKLIYPGAEGSYTMSITNKTGKELTITGLTLEEDTICTEHGCLRLGYLISSGSGPKSDDKPKIDHKGTSASGVMNPKYETIGKISRESKTNPNREELAFSTDDYPYLTLGSGANTDTKADNYIEITIHWKWVDDNDVLDTEIGKEVSKVGNEYGLKVGVNYIFNTKDACE